MRSARYIVGGIAVLAAVGMTAPAALAAQGVTHSYSTANATGTMTFTVTAKLKGETYTKTFTVAINKGDSGTTKAQKIVDACAGTGVILASSKGEEVTFSRLDNKFISRVDVVDPTQQKDPFGWGEDDSGFVNLRSTSFALPTFGITSGSGSDGLPSQIDFGLSFDPGDPIYDVGYTLIPDAGVSALDILGACEAVFSAAGVTTSWSEFESDGVQFTELVLTFGRGDDAYKTSKVGTNDTGLSTYGFSTEIVPAPWSACAFGAYLCGASRRRRG